MESINGILFVTIVLLSLIYSARKASIARGKIKDQANKDYDCDVELTATELKERLGEAEIMYEELEKTYWIHVGVLVGLSSYFYLHNWYLSIGVSLLLMIVGEKFLSIKPFKSGIPDNQNI